MRKITFLFIISSLLFSLLFGCELFNAKQDPDFWQNLEDDIAWSNAPRVTVTVTYPHEWGSSPQFGTNRSRDNARIDEAPRMGYPFEVEFISDIRYVFMEWRAYKTKDLAGLDWMTNLKLLDELSRLSNKEVEILMKDQPQEGQNSRGGKGDFKANITEPVTLIPWCSPKFYIIKTNPRLDLISDSNDPKRFHRLRPINIFFNTAIHQETLNIINNNGNGFTDGIVSIKARSVNKDSNDDFVLDGSFSDIETKYWSMEYHSALDDHVLTIYPRIEYGDIDEGLQIEVTIGPNIKNTMGLEIEAATTFYYIAVEDIDAGISEWSANYNLASNTIDISLGIAGEDIYKSNNGKYEERVEVKARYRANQGQSFTLNCSIDTDRTYAIENINKGKPILYYYKATIFAVGRVDTSGVRQGRSISGVQEYTIYISVSEREQVSDDVEIKIWNLDGMSINKGEENLFVEVNSKLLADNDGQLKMTNEQIKSGIFVLTENINLTAHTPIGTIVHPFSGKFYGNGNTISITGLQGNRCIGLFGEVDGGAVVRDLTVNYVKPEVSITTNEVFFGGIAGLITGNARLQNALVTGELALNMTGSGIRHICAGGITGQITGDAQINNAYSSLDLTVNTTTNGRNFVGGIVGSMGRSDTGASVIVQNASAVGSITVDSANSALLSVGGLVGFINGLSGSDKAEILNSDYRDGTIKINSNGGDAAIGGGIGRIHSNAEISESSSRASELKINIGVGTNYNVGGFIGDILGNGTTVVTGCSSETPVDAKAAGTTLLAGGFVGNITLVDSIEITYCYAKGNVTADGANNVYAGGFTGSAGDNVSISKCYADGNVTATATSTGTVYAGGFAGDGYSFTDCYALGNVNATSSSTGNSIGGFVGQLSGGSLNRCFARGSLNASSGTFNAGGLVGNIVGGTLNNSVALNENITYTDPQTNVGRVFGNPTSSGHVTYAYDGMYTNTSKPTSNDDSSSHGKNVNFSQLQMLTPFVFVIVNNVVVDCEFFWTDTLNFNNHSGGYGSLTETWDFSGLWGKGHPDLNGKDGLPMPGQ
ncbi:MAG: hypothetical protein LBU66_00935 [Treponema sp.]|nr:hypothetical protein [Treponema sp.]